MEVMSMAKEKINFTKISQAERAFTGCHNPTIRPIQRQALQILLSRH
jgi:hypothetical protein